MNEIENEKRPSEHETKSRRIEQRLYSPREAAAMLGMSVSLLTEHAKGGSIGYVETGFGKKNTRRAYLKSDIDQFIAQNRVFKTEPPKPKRDIGCVDLQELRVRRKKTRPRPDHARGLARG